MTRFLRWLLACSFLGLTGPALAGAIVEVGDAGDLPGTAQVTTGTTDITSIAGTISDASDVDMYRIRVTGSTAVLLQASTTSAIDSQLFVFDAHGMPIIGNDDLGFSLDASITAALLPGIYYVAVTSWDRDPVNAGGMELFDDIGGALQMPINPGPVAGYNDTGGVGSYLIEVRGVAPAVPEPGTLSLLGALLASAGFARVARRR